MRLAPTPRPRLGASIAGLLAGALLAAFALGCANEAKAARGMEIGLQDDTVFIANKGKVRGERAYRYARSIGVTRIRVNVQWAYLLPRSMARRRHKPQGVGYNLSGLDAAVGAAARHGIRMQLALTGPAPAWATSKHKVGPVRPNSRQFAAFARVVALHFRGRVDRYSIWNEPNWKGWLSPLRSGPRLYRSLYVRGRQAIKQADPRAKVLIGETAPFRRRGLSTAPLAFLRKVACVNSRYRRVSRRCPKLQADGYAHHPYDFRHSPRFRYPGADNVTIGTLSRLTRALDRLRRSRALRTPSGGRMPVHLTEYGYFSSGHRALRKRVRTRYLKGGFLIALRNRRVRSMVQYLLVQPRGKGAYFNTALLTRRGHKTVNYTALRSFYRSHRRSLKRPGGPIRF